MVEKAKSFFDHHTTVAATEFAATVLKIIILGLCLYQKKN